MNSIKNEILVAQKDNCLLEKIQEILYKNLTVEKSLILIIEELHNSGKINIIDAILKCSKDCFIDESNQLYCLSSFLDNLLIVINIDVITLMKCSKIINQNGAIRQLCSKDPNINQCCFNLTINNLEHFNNFLPILINLFDIKIFNNQFTKLMKLIDDATVNILIKQKIILGLSRLTFFNEVKDENIDQIIERIEKIVDQKTNQLIYGEILYLLVTIYVHFPNKEFVINLIDKILLEPNEQVIKITVTLIFCIKNIPNILLNKIVSAIVKLNFLDLKKYQTQIDLSVKYLFEFDFILAFFLLENLLTKNKIKLIFFDYTLSLISESEKLSNFWITKLLLSSNYVLQSNCSCIINHKYEDNKTITVDTSLVDLTKKNICLFLAHKIFGWLYYSPNSVISYIFSLLEVTKNKHEKEEIIKFFFSNIVLNYPKTFQKFIEDNKKSFTLNIKRIVTFLLNKHKEFLKNNEIEENIFELHPSVMQREKYYKYQCDINDEINKKAHKGSLFGEIETIVTLYGNGALYYVNSANGNQKILQRTPFHKFSYSTELPLRSIVDNSGWKYLLYTCRTKEYV